MVALQADGSYKLDKKQKALTFGFKRERKIARMHEILKGLELSYKTWHAQQGRTLFSVHAKSCPSFLVKHFDLPSLLALPLVLRKVFVAELVHWDGSHDPRTNDWVEYSSCNKQDAVAVQTVAMSVGCRTGFRRRERRELGWSDSYRVSIWTGSKTMSINMASQVALRETTEEMVYCPTTSTGFFMARRNGKIFITGNSGGGDGGGKFNVQNMYRSSIFGVDVRKLFVPPAGHKFIVSDYAQVEARVLLGASVTRASLIC